MTVTDEQTGELEQFPKLLQKVMSARNKSSCIEKTSDKLGIGITAFGDKICATRENLICCAKYGVKPVLKIIIRSSGKSHGCIARKRLVVEQLGGGLKYISELNCNQKLNNQKKWLMNNDYGKRQGCRDCIFHIQACLCRCGNGKKLTTYAS